MSESWTVKPEILNTLEIKGTILRVNNQQTNKGLNSEESNDNIFHALKGAKIGTKRKRREDSKEAKLFISEKRRFNNNWK